MPIVNNFPPASSSDIFPGMILMWSGTIDTIPGGWQLCDGTNGTPNLVDRFIVGAGSSYDVGGTGGSASVTLTTAQMPSHTHTATTTIPSGGTHKHTIYVDFDAYSSNSGSTYKRLGAYDGIGGTNDTGSLCYIGTDNNTEAGSHTHTATTTNTSVGSGSSHENRPPYYALAYIMKM